MPRDETPNHRPTSAGAPLPTMTSATNIVLIGMPAVGKSTVGVLLAKATGRDFIDTDVLLQARQGRTLQQLIDAEGLEGFCRLEARVVLDLWVSGCVIATGGSVVYSRPAMEHLAAGGVIVHLDDALDVLRRRLEDLRTRGVVIAPAQDLPELYRSRWPLYQRYAQVTIPCGGKNQDQITAEIVSALGL